MARFDEITPDTAFTKAYAARNASPPFFVRSMAGWRPGSRLRR